MKPFIRDLRLALLVGAISFIVCWASNSLLFSNTKNHDDADEWIKEQLDITPAQRQKLVSVEQEYAKRREALQATIRVANSELAEAILADGRYSKRVAAANAKIHEAQGELKKVTLEHFFEMQPALTEEQRNKMNRIAADVLYHNH